jgi:5'-3' exonuclease
MEVYLIDGTYELFRHYYAVPSQKDLNNQEVGAVRGVLNSVLNLIEIGVTHIGVATDRVIESFRNDLYPHYKTGEGIDPELWSQFPILEEGLEAMGVKLWPMVEFEADDALAAAAHKSATEAGVDRVVICTPDKDLSQCVVGKSIVQLDRRKNIFRDEDGVVEKFGVLPISIPDYLALVGDTADGYPGLAGWGAKAASSVLSQYQHFEEIPKQSSLWHHSVRNSTKLAQTLFSNWDDALLFRTLATLRIDVPVFESLDELQWKGASPSFAPFCERLKAQSTLRKLEKLSRFK